MIASSKELKEILSSKFQLSSSSPSFSILKSEVENRGCFTTNVLTDNEEVKGFLEALFSLHENNYQVVKNVSGLRGQPAPYIFVTDIPYLSREYNNVVSATDSTIYFCEMLGGK